MGKRANPIRKTSKLTNKYRRAENLKKFPAISVKPSLLKRNNISIYILKFKFLMETEINTLREKILLNLNIK